MKHKFTVVLCLLLALLCLLSACTKRELPAPTPAPTPELVPIATPAPVATPAPTEEPAPVETPAPTEEPVAAPAFTNPLTGEGMDEDISSLRPITCMFNNHPNALPQCGISSADIIYEMPEETITRMLGVFSEMPDCERLGSVRSTRPYHVDVSLSYDAIFVHWGRSDRAANLLWNTGIDHIELNESPAYSYAYKDKERLNKGLGTEHCGFITTEKLTQFLTDKSWRTEHNGEHGYGFRFGDLSALSDPAAEVDVNFAGKHSVFKYNAAEGGYQLYQNNGAYSKLPNGGLYVDGDSGVVPTFRNLLVLRTTIYDETSIASIVLTDCEDTGYLFCDGKMQQIKWRRGDYNDNFEYFNSDGTPLNFGVGKTYVCIVSHGDSVNYS